jgi:hypothetical protein
MSNFLHQAPEVIAATLREAAQQAPAQPSAQPAEDLYLTFRCSISSPATISLERANGDVVVIASSGAGDHWNTGERFCEEVLKVVAPYPTATINIDTTQAWFMAEEVAKRLKEAGYNTKLVQKTRAGWRPDPHAAPAPAPAETTQEPPKKVFISYELNGDYLNARVGQYSVATSVKDAGSLDEVVAEVRKLMDFVDKWFEGQQVATTHVFIGLAVHKLMRREVVMKLVQQGVDAWETTAGLDCRGAYLLRWSEGVLSCGIAVSLDKGFVTGELSEESVPKGIVFWDNSW